MDGAIGQNQQDRVLLGTHHRLDILPKLLQDRSEQSRPAQPNLLYRVLVCLNDLGHADDIRVLSVAIDSEAMTDRIGAHVPRYPSKSKDWEAAVVVIRLDDLADVPQRLLVHVLIPVAIEMERTHLSGVTVTGGVVDGADEADLPTRAQVVHQVGAGVHFKLIKDKLGARAHTPLQLGQALRRRYRCIERVEDGTLFILGQRYSDRCIWIRVA